MQTHHAQNIDGSGLQHTSVCTQQLGRPQAGSVSQPTSAMTGAFASATTGKAPVANLDLAPIATKCMAAHGYARQTIELRF